MKKISHVRSLRVHGRLLDLQTPIVMGIVNTTPDSFYSSSRSDSDDATLRKAEQMLQEGATILDLGGQSTRPGAERIGEEEELSRVISAVHTVATHFPDALISIDTFYGRVAREAVSAGAALVNDTSAGNADADMWPAIAKLQVPYVLMHMQGEPTTMQKNPAYKNVMDDIVFFFSQRINQLQALGVNDIILDPGFGFGKTLQHNYTVLGHFSEFNIFELPLLAGLSRKGMIQKAAGTDAAGSLNATTAAHMMALMNGASILRVHDVKEAVETIRIYDLAKQQQ